MDLHEINGKDMRRQTGFGFMSLEISITVGHVRINFKLDTFVWLYFSECSNAYTSHFLL